MLSNYLMWCSYHLIVLSGDVETNPGLKPNSKENFSISHWNFSSISVHNYSKISLLTKYNLVHRFETISLSETNLNFGTSIDNSNLSISDYNIFRADHH